MTDLPPNVRIAQPQDEERLFQYLRIVHAENSLASMSEAKVRSMLHRLTHGEGIIGMILGENGIEAAIGMYFSQWWYSDENHLEEIWNFVHPAHRKSTHAKSMIDFGKHCAETFKMPLLIGVLSNTRTEAKVRLYTRSLPNAGALFMYVPEGLEAEEAE